jgi:hypothetical protein
MTFSGLGTMLDPTRVYISEAGSYQTDRLGDGQDRGQRDMVDACG